MTSALKSSRRSVRASIRAFSLLEMLIGKRAVPDPAALADPSFQLKSLLKP